MLQNIRSKILLIDGHKDPPLQSISPHHQLQILLFEMQTHSQHRLLQFGNGNIVIAHRIN